MLEVPFGGLSRWFVTQKRLFPLAMLRPLQQDGCLWEAMVQLAGCTSQSRAITLYPPCLGAPSRVCFNLCAGIKGGGTVIVSAVEGGDVENRDSRPRIRETDF
jgi:hypothetical protein